jgi:hypothetical protein
MNQFPIFPQGMPVEHWFRGRGIIVRLAYNGQQNRKTVAVKFPNGVGLCRPYHLRIPSPEKTPTVP